jgi:hypothetical protein
MTSTTSNNSFIWKKISNWKKIAFAFDEKYDRVVEMRTIVCDWLCSLIREQYPVLEMGQYSSMISQLTFTYIDRHIFTFYEMNKTFAKFKHMLQLFGMVALRKVTFALYNENPEYTVISRARLIYFSDDTYSMKEFDSCYCSFPNFKYTRDIPMNYIANYDDSAVHKCAEIMISPLSIDLTTAKIAEEALLWASKDPRYDKNLEVRSLTITRVSAPDKLHADYQVKPFVYTMEKYLGSGGFGDVYRARDEKGNLVAIKLLRHMDPDFYMETFFEYHTIQDLVDDCKDKPKSLLSYIDCGFFHVVDTRVKIPRIYMCTVMEYFEGVDLISIQGNHDTFETILRSILECVNYIHSKGYAHRDLKPTNILVNPVTLEIKVIDYGTITSDLKRHKAHDMIRGTHWYLSPVTFATPKESYSTKDWQKEDIWAIGQTIYNLAYPHPSDEKFEFYGPVNSESNSQSIRRKVKNNDFRSWTECPTPKGKIGDLLRLIFTIDAAKRPSAGELLNML